MREALHELGIRPEQLFSTHQCLAGSPSSGREGGASDLQVPITITRARRCWRPGDPRSASPTTLCCCCCCCYWCCFAAADNLTTFLFYIFSPSRRAFYLIVLCVGNRDSIPFGVPACRGPPRTNPGPAMSATPKQRRSNFAQGNAPCVPKATKRRSCVLVMHGNKKKYFRFRILHRGNPSKSLHNGRFPNTISSPSPPSSTTPASYAFCTCIPRDPPGVCILEEPHRKARRKEEKDG